MTGSPDQPSMAAYAMGPESQPTADSKPDRVDDATVDNWGVCNPKTGWHAFTDHERANAERRLERLSRTDPDVVLARRPVRTRTEVWHGEIEVVPWHSRCDWIAEGDENGRKVGEAWCMTHKHKEGTLVPAEHIRGDRTDA